MDEVVQGTDKQNILKLVGRFGFSEGQATNVIPGLLGGTLASPAVPIVGQAARKLSQRATQKGVDLVDAMIKAGPDARKITKAYLTVTPRRQVSPIELSELFLENGADINKLVNDSDKLIREAAEVAKGRLAFGAGALAGGSIAQAPEEEQ